jgi:hypothetical protein
MKNDYRRFGNDFTAPLAQGKKKKGGFKKIKLFRNQKRFFLLELSSSIAIPAKLTKIHDCTQVK